MSNFIQSNNIKKYKKNPQIYTYYPEFIQKNNNLAESLKNCESYNQYVSISQRPINKSYKNCYFDKINLVYLEESNANLYGIDSNYNLYQSNNIFDEDNIDEKALLNKNKYNIFRNINLKNHKSFITKNNDIFEEYCSLYIIISSK